MKRKPAQKTAPSRRAPRVIPESPAARVDAIAKGSTAVRLVWESGALTIGDSNQLILVYDGLYTDLLALGVAVGDTITGYADWRVSGATLSPKKGGLGRLTITMGTTSSWAGSISSTALRTRWEVDMAQIEKPILTHPKLTDTMREHIQLWMGEPDHALKAWGKYKDEAGAEQELDSDELIWAEKIKNGVESYLVFSPVITKITTYDGAPETTRPGYIDEAGPGAYAVAGFEYLKTADRKACDESGKWTRTEQWTGADSWDTDLYTAAAAP